MGIAERCRQETMKRTETIVRDRNQRTGDRIKDREKAKG
jgi:hypothetical protein